MKLYVTLETGPVSLWDTVGNSDQSLGYNCNVKYVTIIINILNLLLIVSQYYSGPDLSDDADRGTSSPH